MNKNDGFTKAETDSQLRSCPFCGSSKVDAFQQPSQGSGFVKCLACGTRTENASRINMAVATWNVRAYDTASGAFVRELRNANEAMRSACRMIAQELEDTRDREFRGLAGVELEIAIDELLGRMVTKLRKACRDARQLEEKLRQLEGSKTPV